ncbi:flagellar basal body rod protein FlgC [Amaricoccus solimangrovi]|uniref:Flagellar basal body rod protein FlgB n=1 Tax=Amaricoccus solimangrovi TaxID=2589815 RepID=A0A501WWI0_9RHOB|nr:flagellar basal body rod protein FlgC [Amaricoccus solimangrovi]TPE52494.1 flagellar basal body rod protein FlgC [Amaricoccus solimangrovi]
MDDLLRTLATAASGMRAQATRVRLGAENIANADTPGYRRKTVSFEEAHARAGDPVTVTTGPVMLDQSETRSSFEPDNPLADGDGYVHGSNVDLMVEIADSREANRSYEANLRVFDQARRMADSLLGLLRR